MDTGADSYRRYRAGDDEGLVEIIREYRDGVVLFLDRYVNSIPLAEELAEETFFRLAVKKPLFAPRGTFKTWLYTITRNVALDALRRDRSLAPLPTEASAEIAQEVASPEQAYLREERKIAVRHALRRLNDAYAEALYLKYFEDMDNEAIAKVLHKTRRQVENLLYQAKRSLKDELQKEGITDENL